MRNETLDAIAKRYSCRDFKSDTLSSEIIQAIADAAIQAPSAMNRQPWRVVVVTDKTLLQDLESEGMSFLQSLEDKSTYDRIMERGGTLFYNAPCMIVIPVEKAQYESALIDCGIMCQNITLAAQSLGVASVICGLTRTAFASGTRSEEFCTRLGFPEGFTFACSVLLGFANTAKEPHTPDKDKIIFVR